jgi:hypothetical protein
MMELCVDLESEFKIIIDESLSNVKTVQELIILVKSGGSESGNLCNIEDFPFPKSKQHIKELKRYMCLSHLLWRFNVTGTENIPTNKNYMNVYIMHF